MKFMFVSFIILCGACFAVSEATAATINCIFSWPQQVVVDGFAHSCDSARNYCNYDKAAQIGRAHV